ncbi:DUF397 domain-containing protein [Allosalinactinospora lopnorensis]|uniref:DUF397 domain-containing protein n=1 Tax=Allosalinactinospora lopnorensis TaxID=1352348 RepID=UPI000623CCF6|nr:DUF397 domain-containing protein [Allosalinactinospora lopnorensis]
MASTREWHKSSYSNGSGGNCVEVAEGPEVVRVRDTQNRQLGHLDFNTAEWSFFLREVKADHL